MIRKVVVGEAEEVTKIMEKSTKQPTIEELLRMCSSLRDPQIMTDHLTRATLKGKGVLVEIIDRVEEVT